MASQSECVRGTKPGDDYPGCIRALRVALGLTQMALAARLGVSFATVNRWENGKSRPSQLSWGQLRKLERAESGETVSSELVPTAVVPLLDFTGNPDHVKLLVEGERLSYGHLANPAFATEIASIDPLPHQRIAVYDRMLRQTPLRFLLADDAGAGKTIMAGLYIREMLSRRLLRRILIVPPAGLVGNWRRELQNLFSLPFHVLSGADAAAGNPFVGAESDQVIISLDTLTSPRVFGRLAEPYVIPYDLVIFDEAHKLSADRGTDRRVRKTDRYCLAEALAGVQVHDERWQLGWSAHNFLLLTATPHMGKDYPYYALWKLLQPETLTTPEALEDLLKDLREPHFIRRTKEEMVHLDGRPLYPRRTSDTLGYELSQGSVSEQTLYDETTEYLRVIYNKAKLLNQEAARLAMGVFQRRLASSTYALLRSLARRIEKLDRIIEDIREGRITSEQLITLQRRLHEDEDVYEGKTADEEAPEDGREEGEASDERLLEGVVAASVADLLAERGQVEGLLRMAKDVLALGEESKFERLRQVLTDPRFSQEKLIVFTEHRDTLDYLVRRLQGMGYTGQIAQIHGGMGTIPDKESGLSEREKQVEFFRGTSGNREARFLICTDAAGEGINLQFCRIMINYDVPWNPARLEQRMGRIHRYGQKHDVTILNLVAPTTREGKVLKVLLEKLEKIRKELESDKVFDCIGRIFRDLSIKKYMELAVTEDADAIARELDGKLTKERIREIEEQDASLYGMGGDVAKELPRLRESMDQEIYRRLMPGYVQQYFTQAAPLLDLAIDGDPASIFSLRPLGPGAMDPLLSVVDIYPEDHRDRFCITRQPGSKSIWLHPGEPVFECFRGLLEKRLAAEGARGAIFIDPTARQPYLIHLAIVTVLRSADENLADLRNEEVLEERLIGIRQAEGTEMEICPPEQLLLLHGGRGVPGVAQRLAAAAPIERTQALTFLEERIVRGMAAVHRQALLECLPDRINAVTKGNDYREAELAAQRAALTEKARAGKGKAVEALEEVKRQQRLLLGRRDRTLAILRRAPELVTAGPARFIAHALVTPSADPEEMKRHDADVELVAMNFSCAYDEAAGATVHDVHTPELARAAGLPDNPGFDLLAVDRNGLKKAIEVKGRADRGEVEVSANEWARACIMRGEYWLYVVHDCATAAPRLRRVRDPFGSLLARSKGSVLISERSLLDAEERGDG